MADETEFKNVKFTWTSAVFGLVLFALLYVVPGIYLGRHYRPWAGLLMMAFGAVFMVIFAWRCIFAPVLIADRDAVRLKGHYGETLSLGYERIHEAQWSSVSTLPTKIFGPLFFLEPVWFLQRKGGRRLTVVYGGPPLELDEDEWAGLDEFARILVRYKVKGIADDAPRPQLKVFGGK